LTYSSVVSRDSVHIGAFTIAALNNLKLLSSDIQNAYLTADCHERIYCIAGPEFGSESGSIMVIKKALYGLKTSGTAFRAHLVETLYELNHTPMKADPDVWIRPEVKPDGFEYYEMVLVYVNDVLCISHDPAVTMKGI
jgi:Reverse transcriptase (RNA-dependent DNA polymerase)